MYERVRMSKVWRGRLFFFREKPKAAQRGPGKYSTGGRLPPPDTKECPVHNIPLKRFHCTCHWTITSSSSHWTVQHFGSHDHPAPMVSGSSHRALQKVQKLLKVNPKLTPLELVSGTESRPSIVDLDPKMHNRDYVSNIKKRATMEFNKHVLGSAFAVEALDTAFQWFDELEQWKSMIYDSSASGTIIYHTFPLFKLIKPLKCCIKCLHGKC